MIVLTIKNLEMQATKTDQTTAITLIQTPHAQYQQTKTVNLVIQTKTTKIPVPHLPDTTGNIKNDVLLHTPQAAQAPLHKKNTKIGEILAPDQIKKTKQQKPGTPTSKI